MGHGRWPGRSPSSLFCIVFAGVRSDVARLGTDLRRAEDGLQALGTPAPEILDLTDVLSQTVAMIHQVEEARPTMVASRIDWSRVMAAIGNYDPAQIRLTYIEPADSQTTLRGKGADHSVVSAYADSPKASALFQRVEVRFVGKAATPFATPTSMATPTITATASPTFTPPLSRAMSTNRTTSAPNPSPWESLNCTTSTPSTTQTGSRFLAKRGHRYQVSTRGWP